MISIVVPCYNAAATLQATVESVLAQEIEKEIIIVDDGSTDASAEIIRSFGDRVRAIGTPNRGVSSARNLGTELARGRFIQYLDSDDLLVTGTLASRRNALDQSGADVVHTDWQKLQQLPDGNFSPGEIVRPDVHAISCDAEAAAASTFWAPPAALLYRRTIVDLIGPWSPHLPIIQDARFLFEAAACGAYFVHLPGVGAYYRVSSESLSHRSMERFIADCAINTAEIEALWRSRGIISDERRRTLAGMWWHVAHAALLNGLCDFERARAGYNTVASKRLLLEGGFVLRSVLGRELSSGILEVARRRSKWMRAR